MGVRASVIKFHRPAREAGLCRCCMRIIGLEPSRLTVRANRVAAARGSSRALARLESQGR
jgi:hypothetical protein